MEFKDKVILVTGASSGIGFETAKLFLEKGARVFMNGRDTDKLKKAISAMNNLSGLTEMLAGDVSVVGQCAAMVEKVQKAAGRLDVLVNAAGVWVEGKSDQMTEQQWDETMNINAKGTFFMCRYAIPLLEKSGGVIVNVSSDSGLIGNNEAAIYCASKGAVTLLTKALAVELAPRGIRVNAVCPCDVETPMLAKACDEFGSGDRETYYKSLLSHYPQGEKSRFTQPREVAEAIAFLASPSVQAITGACLSVDFGLTAGY
jgi:NAD(P)-dependent dehydrogenase (short-subunit alcohol dehydrogenase family)